MHLAVKRFRSWDASAPIRIISNYDTDGISACAILVKALNHENRKYVITILPQLRKNIIDELSREDYKHYFFCDLGSGQISALKDLPKSKEIIILDHHEIQDSNLPDNIFLVNPHIFDIDGGKEISGAGVTYLFSRALNPKNVCMAHIGVIGAIGDVQEKNGTGFNPLVHEILEDAIKAGLIERKLGFRMYGSQTRPVHKCLEFCTDPFIPGVSGSESSALQFLQEIGIDPRKGKSDWKKMSDLTQEETKRLAAAIIMKRHGEEKPEDIFGYNYILLNEKPDSPLRDAKEFSTLLNSCGRLNKSSLGIGVCLGDEQIKKKALANLMNYKKEIMQGMNWFKDNLDKTIIKGDNYVIINAGDRVRPSVIGTITSMIARSGEFPDNTVMVSMAQDLDGTTKVSGRIAGIRPAKSIDLKELMVELIEDIGGEAGGHMQAAGCQFPTEKEQEFIEKVKEILGRKLTA